MCFLGLTWPEVLYAILLNGSIAMGVGLVIGFMINKLMIALPIFLILGMILFVLFAQFMQRVKHNRPDGYYQQKIMLFMQRMGFGHWYITKSGYRDPRRLNCDHSPEQIDAIRLDHFFTRMGKDRVLIGEKQ